MAYTITDFSPTQIEVDDSGLILYYIDKSNLRVSFAGTIVTLNWHLYELGYTTKELNLDYTDVTSPAEANASDLADAIQAMIDTMGGSPVGNHDILSTVHGDTLPAAVQRGDLIVGNSTPLWSRKAVGTVGKVIRSDGNDPQYSTFTIPDTYAQGDLIHASASNVLVALAKDTNATRYLSNTGTNNDPAWAQVNAANGVTGVLPIANGGTNAITEAAARANLNVWHQCIDMYAALGSAVVAETFPMIGQVTLTNAMTSQRVLFTCIWLAKAMTLTGVKFYEVVQGSYTANNNNKIGLYTYSAGTLTLVASSTDDGNLWKVNNNWGTKAFSSGYVAAAGLYFVAALYCSSAQVTAPTLIQAQTGMGQGWGLPDASNSAKLSAFLGSQTDLPASTTMAALTATVFHHYFSLY